MKLGMIIGTFIFLPALALWGQDQGSVDPDQSSQLFWAPEWRTKSDCGQVAAYYIARLHGHDVQIDDVKRAIPETDEGVNCLQVESYLRALGLNYRTGWIRPASLTSVPVPAIVQTYNKRLERGHFTVLLDYDEADDSYIVLDTTFGGIRKLNGRGLRRTTTGYVIAKPQGRPFTGLIVGVSSIALIILLIGPPAARRISRRKQANEQENCDQAQ